MARSLALLAAVGLVPFILSATPPPPVLAAPFCATWETPQFGADLQRLRDAVGPVMGEPIECDHVEWPSRDLHQQTTAGLAYVRFSTGIPTFTDGATHWALTFEGLVTWTDPSVDPPSSAFSQAATQTVPTSSPRKSVAEIVAQTRNAVLFVTTGEQCGTAFIVTPDGYAITNEHVIGGARMVRVWDSDGLEYPSVPVVAIDEANDLALLKLSGPSFTHLLFGDSDTEPMGSGLVVIGYPLCGSLTVTTGVLSARQSVRGAEFIQTDATVNGGNSGGPALNPFGALVGIANFKIGGFVAGIENTNFLIPANRARLIVDDWIRRHRAGALLPPPTPTPTPLPTPTSTPWPTPMPTPTAWPTPTPTPRLIPVPVKRLGPYTYGGGILTCPQSLYQRLR